MPFAIVNNSIRASPIEFKTTVNYRNINYLISEVGPTNILFFKFIGIVCAVSDITVDEYRDT